MSTDEQQVLAEMTKAEAVEILRSADIDPERLAELIANQVLLEMAVQFKLHGDIKAELSIDTAVNSGALSQLVTIARLTATVEMLRSAFWREKPGYHMGEPCVFCGRAFDNYGIGECPGTLVSQEAKDAAIELRSDIATDTQPNDLLGILSRLQSEHSDLIERERRLEAELAAIPWDAINVLTYETVNSVGRDYIMAMAIVADWIVLHTPRTPNIVP